MSQLEVDRIASIRQRLLNRSRERGEVFQLVLDQFAVERLLYRLSQSPYQDEFLLKGAMLFALWFDHPHRPTRDADFLGFGQPDAKRLGRTVRELCAIETDDGLRYVTDSIKVEAIREDAKYDGLRVTLVALLGGARCNVQWDVGFGDAVTPGPSEVIYPTLLEDMSAPTLQVYPRETVFAEKLEAIAQLGIANSRMKDYFDLLALAREGAMSSSDLSSAIRATFERRGTQLPEGSPFGLTDEFALDPKKQTQWLAFLGKNKLQAPDLQTVVKEIREFILATKERN